jgi:hypothetical protein
MPTNTRRLPPQKEFSIRPPNLPTATPDDVLGGQKWWGLLGGGFSKIFDPRYRSSPRPRAEVFEFLEPFSPDSLPTSPGGRGSSRVVFDASDAAGAPSSQARRTDIERQRGFVLPQIDHPEKSLLGSACVLRNPVFSGKPGFCGPINGAAETRYLGRCTCLAWLFTSRIFVGWVLTQQRPSLALAGSRPSLRFALAKPLNMHRKIPGFSTTSDEAREWHNPSPRRSPTSQTRWSRSAVGASVALMVFQEPPILRPEIRPEATRGTYSGPIPWQVALVRSG